MTKKTKRTLESNKTTKKSKLTDEIDLENDVTTDGITSEESEASNSDIDESTSTPQHASYIGDGRPAPVITRSAASSSSSASSSMKPKDLFGVREKMNVEKFDSSAAQTPSKFSASAGAGTNSSKFYTTSDWYFSPCSSEKKASASSAAIGEDCQAFPCDPTARIVDEMGNYDFSLNLFGILGTPSTDHSI